VFLSCYINSVLCGTVLFRLSRILGFRATGRVQTKHFVTQAYRILIHFTDIALFNDLDLTPFDDIHSKIPKLFDQDSGVCSWNNELCKVEIEWGRSSLPKADSSHFVFNLRAFGYLVSDKEGVLLISIYQSNGYRRSATFARSLASLRDGIPCIYLEANKVCRTSRLEAGPNPC
jgi:hypothetical protein